MRDSFAELGDLVLPVLTIVLALGAVRMWRERAPRGARSWPGALPWKTRSRSCVRPSATAYSADFDRGQVLRDAKRRFVELQAAWDARDLERLRNWTTPEMLDELLGELSELPAARDRTEVTALHAELLGFERIADLCLTSIEFSGTVRESLNREPVSFREVWMMTHPVGAASEWRLARQQTLF
jgi:predicted lipid-binding transport protein (Tim44 family)